MSICGLQLCCEIQYFSVLKKEGGLLAVPCPNTFNFSLNCRNMIRLMSLVQ